MARLADMALEGIDQAVLFPSVGLYFWALDDPRAAVAIARAYNDWLASYCAADPTRLFGAAMLPMQDPAAAAAELARARHELGFVAAFVRPNPCCGRSLSDLAYEPVWDAAEEHAMTVAVHEGSSVIVPTLGSDRPFNPLVLHAVSHSFEEMLACAQLIAFGVLERHPSLRVVFLESSGGWVPFWMERLDEQAESFGGFCPHMRLTPSEYFARQCWISYEIDERTLPALAPFIGERRIVWGSDYPHHDATFPGAVDTLRATMAPLAPEVQARILGANAAELYRLPPYDRPSPAPRRRRPEPCSTRSSARPAPATETPRCMSCPTAECSPTPISTGCRTGPPLASPPGACAAGTSSRSCSPRAWPTPWPTPPRPRSAPSRPG